jgi:hypothetical protein
MTTTDAAPETKQTTPPAPPAAALATVPQPAPQPAAAPEPQNAPALRSLEADERAAELPDAPSKTMNAFASGYAFETAQRMANALASSSVVPKAYIGNPANCLIAMEVANRMAMSVIAVMQNLDIVHGNPSWRSKFLIAMANSSKKFSRLKWAWSGTEGKDDWGCRAYATDLTDGEKLVGPLVSIAIAKAEGWYDRTGTKWKTIPELMLMYRSAGWWARVYDPEDSMGFGTVEEAEDVHGVDFDKTVGEGGMKPVPGMETANQGRRMSLGRAPAAAPVSAPPTVGAVVDAEIVPGKGEPKAVTTTVPASAAAPAPSVAVADTAPPAREPGSDDDEGEYAGDAPTAEELATGTPAPRGKAK